jgi:hypothetical protein
MSFDVDDKPVAGDLQRACSLPRPRFPAMLGQLADIAAAV